MSETTAALPEALPLVSAASPRRGFAFYARIIKISIATTVGLVGTWAALNETAYVTTSNAVVSAYVLDVRTPVEGTVVGLPQSVGGRVETGQVIGSVSNPLVDHQHLDTLRVNATNAGAIAEALAQENAAMAGQRRTLLIRTGDHRSAVTTRLEQQVQQAEHTLSSRRAALLEANAELMRTQALFAEGLVPRADLEKTQAAATVLKEEVYADAAASQGMRTELEAARRGVLAEAGANNDVTYSMQRADELEMRLAANRGSLATAVAEAEDARRSLAVETARDGHLANSALVAPFAGTIWRLGAVNGEHVAAGSPVLSIVDCDQQFVVAEVAQGSLDAIGPNSPATLRFAGDPVDRKGLVTTAWPDAMRDGGSKLAALPSSLSTDRVATVLVRLLPSAAEPDRHESCQVGRAVQVRIPRSASEMGSRWFLHRLGL